MGELVHVLVAGANARCAEAAARLEGVEKVLLADDARFDHMLAEPTAASIRLRAHAAIVANERWQNVMPRVAALLDVMQVSDIIEVGASLNSSTELATPSRPCRRSTPRRSSRCARRRSSPRSRAAKPPRSSLCRRGRGHGCLDLQGRGDRPERPAGADLSPHYHLGRALARLGGELQEGH